MIDIQYLEYHLDSIKTVKVLQSQGSTEEDVCKDFGITGDWLPQNISRQMRRM